MPKISPPVLTGPLEGRLETLLRLKAEAATVGSVTETAVRKYIEGQKGK